MSAEFSSDLDELNHLRTLARRPGVVSFLSQEIKMLEHEQASRPSPTVPYPIVKTPAAAPSVTYTPLSTFSWDQDNDKIKIYISLEGVQEEKLETVFKPMSVDIKFHDVQGKNYSFALPKLNKEITPQKCKLLVKPTRVVITLMKASKGNWLDLHYKEDKLKPSLDKEADPLAGLMGMMKNMYEDGDDEMKRTIAKAWTDARSGKEADPLQRYR